MGITIGGKDWDELLVEIKKSTQWHNGNGAPSSSVGEINDYYLDMVTGDVYKKSEEEIWEYQGNIRGPAGSGASTYVHEQIAPATIWDITHNLGRYPDVTIVDSAGMVVFGDVQYLSENAICVIFTAAFSGKAYLS